MKEEQLAKPKRRLAALIKDDYDYHRPQRGEVYEADILSIGENEVIVDLGTKRDGVVPRKDLELLDDAYRTSLEVGDRVLVVVLKESARNGWLLVSLKQGRDWLRARELLESGKVLETRVMGFNRGGVLVSLGRLRGFVPNSHLTSIPSRLEREALTPGQVRIGGPNPVTGGD